jgi:hypothetical protein
MVMVEIQMSEVDAKTAPVNVGPSNFVCWQSFKYWTTFNNTTFAKNQKYEPLYSDKWRFGQWKIMDIL